MATSARTQSGRRGRGEAPGFTLVELLVVIAIIALLVSMITPSLSTAREMARRAVCIGNQSSIVGALATYHSQSNCFPLNYAYSYPPYSNTGPGGQPRYLSRWSLGCLGPLLGGPAGRRDLRGLEEGEFPRYYVCPAADLDAVYAANDNDRYHACYWTSVAIRANAGLWDADGNSALMGPEDATTAHSEYTPGDNRPVHGGGGGEARLYGRMCPDYTGSHWRHVYCPTQDAVENPAATVFSGDTNDISKNGYPPGQWITHPSWGIMEISCGFERHLGTIVVSYVDGHVGTVTREHIRDVSLYGNMHGNGLSNSAWLIRFTTGCGGSGIHPIRPPRVN